MGFVCGILLQNEAGLLVVLMGICVAIVQGNVGSLDGEFKVNRRQNSIEFILCYLRLLQGNSKTYFTRLKFQTGSVFGLVQASQCKFYRLTGSLQ